MKHFKNLKYLLFAVLLFSGLEASADKKINPYKVLGVSKTASPAEIARAYRKKAIEWHPDKNPSPNAHEKMTEINTAYEILKDPVQRQYYDRNSSARPNQDAGGGFHHTYDSNLNRNLNKIVDKLAKTKRGSIFKPIRRRVFRTLLSVIMSVTDKDSKSSFLFSLLQKIESQYTQHPPNREAVIFRNLQSAFGKKVLLDIILTIDFIQNTETAERFLSYFSSNTSKKVIDSVLFTAQNLPQDSFSRILQSIIENNPARQILESALEELSKINPEKNRSTLISIAVNAEAAAQNRLYALNYIANHFELSENEIRTLQQAQDIETNRRIKRALSQITPQSSQPNSSQTNTNSSSARSNLISRITNAVSRTLSWKNLAAEEKAKILQDFISIIEQQVSRINPFQSSSNQNEEIPQKELTAIAANRSLNIKIRRIALEVFNWQNAASAEKRYIIQSLMPIALNSSEDRKLRIQALNILNSARTDLNSIELSLLDRLANNKEEPKAIRSQAKKTAKKARRSAGRSNSCKKLMHDK